MAFEAEVELIRRRIEAAMNEKYAGIPDSEFTRARINADLQLLHAVFPELDITAEVSDDPQRAPWEELVLRIAALWRQ
jgi:hypothetical protein